MPLFKNNQTEHHSAFHVGAVVSFVFNVAVGKIMLNVLL